MDLILKRDLYRPDGIFGTLLNQGMGVCESLEHSFNGQPIIPPGTYLCVRGSHTLDRIHWFETFEITGVVGHSGLLFHKGNWNKDSKGCVLLGDALMQLVSGDMITGSQLAFDRFMTLQTGVATFNLEVVA